MICDTRTVFKMKTFAGFDGPRSAKWKQTAGILNRRHWIQDRVVSVSSKVLWYLLIPSARKYRDRFWARGLISPLWRVNEKICKAWSGFEMLTWHSISYLKPSSRRSWPYFFHDRISLLYPDDKLKRSSELFYKSKFNNHQTYCYNRGRSKTQLAIECWSIETYTIQKLKNCLCLAMEIWKAIVAVFWQPTDKISVKKETNSC